MSLRSFSFLALSLLAGSLTATDLQASGNPLAKILSHRLRAGQAVLDYDLAAWGTLASGVATPPVLTLDEVFDQAEADAIDYAGMFTTENDPSPSGLGLIYAVNGSTVVNMSGRTAQPTDFTFRTGFPFGLPGVRQPEGAVGLGGLTRWDVSPAAGGGSLLFGDFTLEWHPVRQAVGGSGWHLVGHIAPAATVFDLTNVVVTDAYPYLHISADLAISYEIAYFLFGTPSDHLVDVGDFEFSGYYR